MNNASKLSPTELELRKENMHLKKRMKEMEEIYTAEDEKSFRENQSLRKEVKDVKEQNEHLQNKLYDIETLYSSSPSSPCPLSPCRIKCLPSSFNPTNTSSPRKIPEYSLSSLHSTEYEHDTTADRSFAIHDSSLSLFQDCTNLQESYRFEKAEKSKLLEKNDELNKTVESLETCVKDLSFKSLTQEDEIQILKYRNLELCRENYELKSSNYELCQENDELYKSVGRLQRQLDESKVFTLNETQMSLFDEFEEVRKREEEALLQIVVENNEISENQSIDETITSDINIFPKKRSSFFKKSLLCLASAFSICFDYFATGAKLEFPIVHFLSSDIFTIQARPRIPQL